MSIFTQVQLPKVKSNSFDMSHDVKMSFNMGKLVPIQIQDCMPGDRINAKSSSMLRLAPMLAPIMHKVDVKIEHFFIPYRLVWPGFEKFIVAGVPDINTPAHPYFENVPSSLYSIWDYLGLPATSPIPTELDKISALPSACYNKVFNDWYRDENLQAEVNVSLNDGLNAHADFDVLYNRAWQHDYFTSALPWAQKGNPVQMPLTGFTDVPVYTVPGQETRLNPLGGSFPPSTVDNVRAVTGSFPNDAYLETNGLLTQVDATKSGFRADTSQLNNAAAVTVNTLRWAIQLQMFLERNARGGTRYIENILAHFGVRSSDKRLQRPEYLGGSSHPVIISEVLQTSETATTPLADMAGHGLSVGKSSRVNYFCEEHGLFMSLISVLPKTAYQQGIPKMFSKFDPLDYPWPEFANMGEQEVKNQELYYVPNDAANMGTFGYLPRYSEYKYTQSRVAGDMRDNLAFWHMGRIFNSRPGLNASFIESDPTHRIYAVTDPTINKLYAQIYNEIVMRRPLPKHSIPAGLYPQ